MVTTRLRELATAARRSKDATYVVLTIYVAWYCAPLCKIIPAFLDFRGLAPASLSNQPQPAKSAIFGKIGGKTINLAGTFLHNSAVVTVTEVD